MLPKALQDANPDMKSEAAKFASKLCRDISEKVGPYMKSTVISLVKNL